MQKETSALFDTPFLNTMDHLHLSNIDPSSVIISQTKYMYSKTLLNFQMTHQDRYREIQLKRTCQLCEKIVLGD